MKEQLELARDLLRHAVPNGDLGTIVRRALELLVADLMKRRFGALTREKTRSQTSTPPPQTPETIARHTVRAKPATSPSDTPATGDRPLSNIHPEPPTSTSDTLREQSNRRPRPAVPRAVQRAVLERDGLRCTWRGPDGTRCTARAWLERDHRMGHALGGDQSPHNLRHLCKAHNRRAAEHVHGTAYVNHIIQVKQSRRATLTRSPPA